MKYDTTLFSFLLIAVLGSSLAALRPAAGQDPGSLADVRKVADSYAACLSSCDVPGLTQCTSPAFHERLRVRLAPCSAAQLGSFRRVAETALEADLVQVTLLWTQPDGVLETLPLTVKKTNGQWVVAGGEVP
jgi:hypothetical protein